MASRFYESYAYGNTSMYYSRMEYTYRVRAISREEVKMSWLTFNTPFNQRPQFA